MEQPFPATEQPQKDLKAEFFQGPPQGPTSEQIALMEEQRAKLTKDLEDNLPLRRLQVENNRLGVENLKLQIEEIQALAWLENWKRTQEEAMANDLREKHEQEEAKKQQVPIMVVEGHQYTGDNAGMISTFIKGEDISTAPILEVQDPLKRVGIQVPDSNEERGVRQLSFTPGDWIVKDDKGVFWSMSDVDYKKQANNMAN